MNFIPLPLLINFSRMVLKQKGKPEKGKKPVRGGPRQFSDHREFPDGPIEEFEDLRVRESDSSDSGESSDSSESCSEIEEPVKKPSAPPTSTSASTSSAPKPTSGSGDSKAKPASSAATSNAPKELSRRDREAMQKEQARQHYLKTQAPHLLPGILFGGELVIVGDFFTGPDWLFGVHDDPL